MTLATQPVRAACKHASSVLCFRAFPLCIAIHQYRPVSRERLKTLAPPRAPTLSDCQRLRSFESPRKRLPSTGMITADSANGAPRAFNKLARKTIPGRRSQESCWQSKHRAVDCLLGGRNQSEAIGDVPCALDSKLINRNAGEREALVRRQEAARADGMPWKAPSPTDCPPVAASRNPGSCLHRLAPPEN